MKLILEASDNQNMFHYKLNFYSLVVKNLYPQT